MRISENGRVSFLCGNGEDFGAHFFGATHSGVLDFFWLWGGYFTRDHCWKRFELHVCLCQTHIPEIKAEVFV